MSWESRLAHDSIPNPSTLGSFQADYFSVLLGEVLLNTIYGVSKLSKVMMATIAKLTPMARWDQRGVISQRAVGLVR